MNQIDLVLAEREHTHGSFEANAYVSQKIKQVLEMVNGYDNLTLVQREALDMIALKISRIVTGQANNPDHWLDIQGYARLAQDEQVKI